MRAGTVLGNIGGVFEFGDSDSHGASCDLVLTGDTAVEGPGLGCLIGLSSELISKSGVCLFLSEVVNSLEFLVGLGVVCILLLGA